MYYICITIRNNGVSIESRPTLRGEYREDYMTNLINIDGTLFNAETLRSAEWSMIDQNFAGCYCEDIEGNSCSLKTWNYGEEKYMLISKKESIVSIEETDTIETLIKKWGLDPQNPNWEIDSIGRLKGTSRKYVRNTYKCFLSNFDGNNPSRHEETYKNISSEMDESYVYVDCDFKELTDNYSGVVSGCKVEQVDGYFVVTSTNTCFTRSTGIRAKALLFWSKKPLEIKVEIFGNPERHSRGKIVFSL
jgi:hypothetical protein